MQIQVRSQVSRLLTVPYIFFREIDGQPSWSLDASKTGESTKCPWVGVVGAVGENRETVTASLCLVFEDGGRILASPLIKSVNNLLPWGKACQIREI